MAAGGAGAPFLALLAKPRRRVVGDRCLRPCAARRGLAEKHQRHVLHRAPAAAVLGARRHSFGCGGPSATGVMDVRPLRILIVRRDNIGDLVCTTPLIDALRAHLPKAWIAALVTTY